MIIRRSVWAGLVCALAFPLCAVDPDLRSLEGVWNLNPDRVLVNYGSRLPVQPETGSPAWRLASELEAAGVDLSLVAPKPGPNSSILSNNIVVAYYGHPRSTKMGILGEQSIEETGRLLKAEAARWDAVNGDEGVIPAFHLIYATVWADANVGVLSDEVVKQYVDYAAANNMIVVLDHQLGKYPVEDCMKKMLPWLQYPNVHLAIDPEWKTLNPGKEIGSIYARDVNRAQELMQEYLTGMGAKERRMLIVHQFHYRQILEREQVRDDFDLIDLIHNADGFGSTTLKLDTYRYVAKATNMPVKGFKLFFPKSWKSAGYDKPLMEPAEVLQLKPRPVFINYQ